MKKIFVIAIVFCSCKEQINNMERINEPLSVAPLVKGNDTVIRQQIWYYQSQYVLQTYVQSNEWSYHFSAHRDPFDASMQNNHTYGSAPYNVDIIGSFEYIKNNKAIEYKKAAAFLDSVRPLGNKIRLRQTEAQKKEQAINDSVELLKKL